ncbi:MFS transporter [Phycicoccus sp. HDW14]|nr:MFS transporter [Phycicoccus sp. HDW14]
MYVLDATPAQVGWLTAVALVPNVLFALVAGGLVDRSGSRRRVMLGADVARAVAVLSLPLAYFADGLSLPHLFVVAFVVGACDVVFFVAYNAFVVALVRPAEFIPAMGLLNVSRAGAEIGGLSLGGVVVSALTAPVALAINGLSFVVSAMQLARVRVHEAPPAPRRSSALHLGDGLAWIWRHPVVRTMLLTSGAMNLFAFVANAMLVVYASQTLRMSASLIGFSFAVGAVGGLIGATTFARVQQLLGLGRAIVLASIAFPAAGFLYPLATGTGLEGAAWVAAGEALSAVFVIWLDIGLGAVFAQEVPDELRSRVAGAYRTVNYGVRPVGAALGGLLADGLGLRHALWVSAIGILVSGLFRVRPRLLAVQAPEARPD